MVRSKSHDKTPPVHHKRGLHARTPFLRDCLSAELSAADTDQRAGTGPIVVTAEVDDVALLAPFGLENEVSPSFDGAILTLYCFDGH